ncbi:MAG: PEGA domain-containing protein [Proteobacteria bacterium]|nr:PEGA domain-containing protein [Pseudomonadota bacterium]
MQYIEPVNFEPPKAQKESSALTSSLTYRLLIGFFLLLPGISIWFLTTAKSVSINTHPDNVTVTISSPFKIFLAGRYLLRQGEHTISISSEGYHSLKQALSVSPEQYQKFDYVLKPLPGHLSLNTNEFNGARVFLENIEKGLTPITINNIEAGNYNLRIEAERYFKHEQNIIISGKDITQSLDIELSPAWAKISFDSTPADAEIIIDDSKRGDTPTTLELLEGKHNVIIKKHGFKAWRKKLKVIAGNHKSFNAITLSPADAKLSISSTPAGANVTVDGHYAGQTPLDIAVNPEKKTALKLYKQGFLAKTITTSIKSGETRHLNIVMQSERVDVNFDLEPADAEVFINEQRMSLNGSTLSLPTTQQNISIRKQGYVDYTTRIFPLKGTAQQIKIRLKTLQQQKQDNIKPLITSIAGQRLKLFYPHNFTMGASRREPGRRANENSRNIELKRPFYLGSHEVSNEEFRKFQPQHNSGRVQGNSLNSDKQPVVNISWEQAALYCNGLSEQESLAVFYQVSGNKITGANPAANGYRLPSEAEWAWAARTINKTGLLKFPWGDVMPPPDNQGNYADRNAAGFLGKIINNFDDSYAVAAPIGSFASNQKGLYDMGGNAAEWVHDFYSIQTGGNAPNPLGPDRGEFHIIRGSSWAHGTITELRLSYRDYGNKPREDVGFRIARYLE